MSGYRKPSDTSKVPAQEARGSRGTTEVKSIPFPRTGRSLRNAAVCKSAGRNGVIVAEVSHGYAVRCSNAHSEPHCITRGVGRHGTARSFSPPLRPLYARNASGRGGKPSNNAWCRVVSASISIYKYIYVYTRCVYLCMRVFRRGAANVLPHSIVLSNDEAVAAIKKRRIFILPSPLPRCSASIFYPFVHLCLNDSNGCCVLDRNGAIEPDLIFGCEILAALGGCSRCVRDRSSSGSVAEEEQAVFGIWGEQRCSIRGSFFDQNLVCLICCRVLVPRDPRGSGRISWRYYLYSRDITRIFGSQVYVYTHMYLRVRRIDSTSTARAIKCALSRDFISRTRRLASRT